MDDYAEHCVFGHIGRHQLTGPLLDKLFQGERIPF